MTPRTRIHIRIKKTCKVKMPFVEVNTQFPNIFSESLKMSKKVIGVLAAILVVVAVVTVATIKESGHYLNKDVRNGSSPTSSTMINDPAESTTTTSSTTTTTTTTSTYTIKTSK